MTQEQRVRLVLDRATDAIVWALLLHATKAQRYAYLAFELARPELPA